MALMAVVTFVAFVGKVPFLVEQDLQQ